MNFLFILSVLNLILASTGDRQPAYKDCVKSCVKSCDQKSLSIVLRLTQWTCSDDCKYVCMHKITDSAIANNQQIHQYHGKWPFYRLWGIQEPFAVLFSIGNGYNHYMGAKKTLSRLSTRYPLIQLLHLYRIVSINTWLWSAVFHSRDLPLTEKMDYFSAMLGLLVALCYCLHRVFRIQYNSTVSVTLQFAFITFFLFHISYLSFYRFDYGYNMIAGVTVGLSHNLIWVGWSITSKRTYAWKMGVVSLLLTGTALLEVFDFPAFLRLIDAHALWHGSTIPIVTMYWEFLLEDAMYEVRLIKGKFPE
ncbi:Per1-like protein [Globomyces pollinis-pini]|nr:Per1-like protein [Globomyces pollinis-pini]